MLGNSRNIGFRLIIISWLLVSVIRLLLVVTTYRRIAPFLSASNHPPPPGFARRIEMALMRASRWAPWSTCLAEACAARVLLARRGFGATMRIGVKPVAGNGLVAHAWLVSDGKVILGGHVPDFVGYRDLIDLPG